ncbi:DMT family transporter [[Eubacterium] cellulosolvens]
MIGETLAVIAAIFWATSTVVAAKVLRYMDPLSTNTFRSLFAAITMLLYAFFSSEIQQIFHIDFYGLIVVILAALIGFGIGDSFLYKSITLVGVSRSYIFAQTYPFFTMIFAILFLEEIFHPKYLLGTIIIFLGIIIVITEIRYESKAKNYLGILTALVASIAWSIGLILITIGISKMSVILANTIRFPFLFMFLFVVSRPWIKKIDLKKENLILLFASGILGMTLGGLIFLFGVKYIGVSRATSLGASSPVWASLMSSLFLKEKVTWRILVAAFTVVIGIYFLT